MVQGVVVQMTTEAPSSHASDGRVSGNATQIVVELWS